MRLLVCDLKEGKSVENRIYMMNKKHTSFFKRLLNLLIKTGSEWKIILQDGATGMKAMNQYATPLIAICTAAAFFGSIINRQGADFEVALKISIITFLSIYGGVFLSVLLINKSLRFFNLPDNKDSSYTLVAYGITVYTAISAIIHLIPEFVLLWVCILYTGYLVSEGVKPLFKVRDEHKSGFVLLSSFIILASPFIIHYILKLIMPGFQVA